MFLDIDNIFILVYLKYVHCDFIEGGMQNLSSHG